MKKFIEVALALAILLFTGSAGLSDPLPKFQSGDVFAGIGQGKIQWYRPTLTDGVVVYKLVTTLTIPGTDTYDTGMAFDAAGNLYATDFSAGAVTKFDTHGASSLFNGDFGAVSPESVAFTNTGNLFVGDANGFRRSSESPLQANIFELGPSGNSLTSFTVAAENMGADWIDLAADQKTILYTSEGQTIKRFDTSAGVQLDDFATGLPGSAAYALRILPNGNVLVADSSAVLQLDASGEVAKTYNLPGSGGSIFSLSLDPDGVHFWSGDTNTGKIWQVNIATGAVDHTISTGIVPDGETTKGLFGVAVFGEQTSSNSTTVQFTPSLTPETKIATIGNPTDPAAQSLALTLASVTNTINVSVEFFYEPTELSTGTHGVGIADGICEAGASEDQDFDCRLAGNFTYQVLLMPNGDKVVPHIVPSHNFLGVWVRVIATLPDGSPAVAGFDYNGPVDWYYAWNTNPTLAPGGYLNPGAGAVNLEYSPGWNNMNPQMYDRPGENVDIAFVKNITTYSKNCAPTCVGTADPGLGGRTLTLNDIVAAAPPNPPSGTAPITAETLVPVPGSAPFKYSSRLPMLVSFKLEDESTETANPNGLTPPHKVTVATLESVSTVNVPLQPVKGLPATVTYSPSAKTYFIFLSPAAYKTDGTVYTLQINSDLLSHPFTTSFVVKP